MRVGRSPGQGRNVREESGVSDCLYIGGDEVVIFVSEVDITWVEAREYTLDDADVFV